MATAFDPDSYLTAIRYDSTNFVTGQAATIMGWNGPIESSASIITCALQLAQEVTDEVLPLLDSNITVRSIHVATASFSYELPVGSPGLVSGAAAPPNLAMLVTHSAAGKGRRFRGRNYWPGLVSNSQVNEEGIINGSIVTAVQTMVDTIAANMNSGSEFFSQSIPQGDPSPGGSLPVRPWPRVISSVAQPRAATQRRRLRR